MSCHNKIRSFYSGFSTAEKRVADFFIQNAHQAKGRAIDEIANRIGVSKSTIVRFARSMGFSGYRDFIIQFSATSEDEPLREAEGTIPNYLDISPGDSTELIMGHIFATSRQSIEQTIAVCDEESVSRAVEGMNKARRIDFFGMGSGSIIAQDAQQKFLRINKICYAFADSHAQATVASTLSPRDVCVVISYSGETVDTLRIAEIAKTNEALVVSITKFGDNSISRISDVNLFVSSPESEIRSAATGSRISQLCIIDILYTGVLSLEYDNVKHYLDASRNALITRYRR